MSAQYIFTTHKLSRRYPPDKEVLDRRLPVVLPGRQDRRARLQRRGQVDAAEDHGRHRHRVTTARPSSAPRPPSACSTRSPTSIPAKDVKGNVEDGVAEIRALLDRFNELSMNYSDETADEFSRVQEQIDAVDGWNLDTTLEYAMDALRCPPADADVTTLSGGERRRVAHVPAAAAPARPAAARRADQPPRRRVGGVAGAAPARLQGHRRGRSPTIATSSTTSPAGSSSSTAAAASPTRATTPAGWSRSRCACSRRSARSPAASARSRRSSSGCG